MNLARFSVRNSTVLHMGLVGVVLFGVVSLMRLPRELMTDIQFNWVFASAIYPGASAEEIEQQLTLPMEDAVRKIDGVRSVETRSKEGFNFFNIQFREMSDTDFDKRYRQLKDEFDGVEFPDDAEMSFATAFSSSDFMSIVQVVLAADLDPTTLHDIAERLQDDLENTEDVSKVQVGGLRHRVIHVDADPARLEALGISIQQLSGSLKAANTPIPAGTLDLGQRSTILRTLGDFPSVGDIGRVVVSADLARPGGPSSNGLIRVSDVATVTDGWEDDSVISRFNDRTAVTYSISKRAKGSSIDVVNRIQALADAYNEELGEHGHVTLSGDTTIEIRKTLSVLVSNAIFGFCLVVLVLWLAVGLRNAMITAAGIPVTFLIAFIFMDQTGQSLNGNSLFGLVLVLGIVVDDAIVVLENAHRHHLMGKPRVQAVIEGASEVTVPVLSAILTTIAAFLPLMLMPGIMGKFMRIVPLVVTVTLLASLLEALVLVPSHIVSWGERDPERLKTREEWFSRLADRFERPLRFVMGPKARVLVALGIYLIVVPFAALTASLVGADLYASDEIPQVFALVRLPEGSSLPHTDEVIRAMEDACRDVPEVVNRTANAGLLQTPSEWFIQSSVGQLVFDFTRPHTRDISLDELIQKVRECTATVPGPASIEMVEVESGPPAGADVEVKIQGKDWASMQTMVEKLEAILKEEPGVLDVRNNFVLGKEEIRLRLDSDRATLLGIDEQTAAFLLREAYSGNSDSVYREHDDEADILVRYAPEARQREDWILRTRVPTRDGRLVPLADVTTVSRGRGYEAIRRYNYKRAITISANLDRSKKNAQGRPVTPVSVTQKIREAFQQIPHDSTLSLTFTGQFQEFQESFKALARLGLLGILLIYIILGAQFGSFLQPLIIMGFTFPGALLGSSMGLLVTGNPFSITTMFAMVGLLGIVVNDSLVYVAFINDGRQQGLSPADAVLAAGRVRLRPILLTTATTVLGLLPMSIGLGGRSETWGPLAATIVWGMSFATLTTLFVIPAVYLFFEDLKRWVLRSHYSEHLYDPEELERRALQATEEASGP